MSKQIPIVTFFWAYSTKSKIHALWLVAHVDERLYSLVSRVLDLAVSIRDYAGGWVLNQLKSDYVTQPIPVNDFWALKTDFFLDPDSGNVMSKTSVVTQTLDKEALDLKARVIKVLDVIQTEKIGMENE